jgi:hypothetical protein
MGFSHPTPTAKIGGTHCHGGYRLGGPGSQDARYWGDAGGNVTPTDGTNLGGG